MIVCDSSALVHMFTNKGPLGRRIRGRIEKADVIIAPHLLDVEITSALLGMARGRATRLSQPALDQAFETYATLPLRRYEHVPLLSRLRKLSSNLSIYDATYVALAEMYRVPLITSDARIERARVADCLIEVFA